MKDHEMINKVKKEIKVLESELNESAAQLGGVFYDSELLLTDSEIFNELHLLEKKIPEVKNKLEALQNYNLTITESENKIKESNAKIKELESKIGSVLEKVGVELYCFIGDRELAFPGVKAIYTELKEGELNSESLENRLYKFENNDVKKSFGDVISKPFKVRAIKREIVQNNKDSLKKFCDLGRAYCDIPELINEETNESILDILEEYKNIRKRLKLQADNILSLEKKINENEEKIQKDSDGIKLKSLYSKLEEEISTYQNSISYQLVELGAEIAERSDLGEVNDEIQSKLDLYKLKKLEITKKEKELLFLENRQKLTALSQEIISREKSINIEEEHIVSLNNQLDRSKEELNKIVEESASMKLWLDEHHLDFES